MTGPEHYREAERLLALGAPAAEARAQVHATLALTAATAAPQVDRWLGDESRQGCNWTQAIS